MSSVPEIFYYGLLHTKNALLFISIFEFVASLLPIN